MTRDWDAWALGHGYLRTNPGQWPAHYVLREVGSQNIFACLALEP